MRNPPNTPIETHVLDTRKIRVCSLNLFAYPLASNVLVPMRLPVKA
jgi:hypothetical protein